MYKILKFFQKFKNPVFWDMFFITAVIFLLSFFTSNRIWCLLADHGREYLIPNAILNGYVPYKDFILIYFPLAYYINAFILKILGLLYMIGVICGIIMDFII